MGVGTAVVAVAVLIVLYISMYLSELARLRLGRRGDHARTASSCISALSPAADLKDAHPTWVSYYMVDAHSQHWHHVTTYEVPANTLVHVTVYQYDGQSGLRNPFISQARGTVGNSFLLDGKPTQTIDPDAASHVFAIPELGVSVPLEGIADDAKNPCGNAPCSLSQDHHTIQFTFRTGAKGLYRWQCFVPCAAGFISGWGGPMQTVGYMDGYIKVV